MKRIGLAALAAALISSGAAQGADILGRDGSLKDSSDRPASWTGFIIGGMAGGTFNSTKLDYADHHDLYAGNWWHKNGYNFMDLDVGASLDGVSTVGLHAGGVLGYQRQLGRFVAGVEAWGGWSNAETSASVSLTSTDTAYDGIFIPNGTLAGRVSIKQDYWYAGYAKLGYDLDGLLISGLLGYKAAHLKGDGALKGWDDDFGGVSGGLLVEKMLRDSNIVIGAYGTYTAYEDKKYPLGEEGGLKVDMDGFDVGVRAVAKF